MSERDLILVSVGICVDGSKSNQSFPHEVNNPIDKTIAVSYTHLSVIRNGIQYENHCIDKRGASAEWFGYLDIGASGGESF